MLDSVKLLVEEIKTDFEVVQAISLYNLKSSSTPFSDELLSSNTTVQSMIDENCFEHSDYFFCTTPKIQLMSVRLGDFVATALLKMDNNYNRVLLELSLKKLCKTIGE